MTWEVAERVLDRDAGRPALFYRTAGAGPVVVLVHGVGADGSSWNPIAEKLVARFRVVWLDLRGHGRSGPIRSPITLDSFVEDVIDVMDAEDIGKADLIGFSLGGMIVQGLALDHAARVDRLVIVSAVAGRSEEERARVRARLEILRNEGIGAITGAAQDRWFTDGFIAAYPERVTERMAQLKANDAESYKAAYTVFSTSDLGERLHAIRHQTLVITGEHDIGSNTRMARFMRDQIAGAQLEILPGLKHSVLIEVPERIAMLSMAFLDRVAGADA